MKKKKKLGELLRERGQISAGGLNQAIAEQQGKIVLLGELLLQRQLVTKAQLVSALEEITNTAYVDCDHVSPDPAALAKLSPLVARKCLAFPVAAQGAKLVVVMAEPQNAVQVEEIKSCAGVNISTRFGFRDEILRAIHKYYGDGDSNVAATAEGFEEGWADLEFISTSSRQANQEAMQEVQAELLQNSTPTVKIVSEVIKAANEKHASDIHIEPQDQEVVIRIRVDGVLRDLRRVPRTVQNSLISRIKILSDMDIAERRAPQDGRFIVRIGSQHIDMRVSTLPTQYGEKVVMRLLNSETGIMSLQELHMPKELEETFRKLLSLPQGMVLVTGPTGSGKSTTLYTALNYVRRPSINIVTVEDPVEYVLPGINQVHVNNKAGLTFAGCLRSILRQDPNIIMVGEIRDKETAEIAMKAAQTGHLVLSTLHTNDSLSAVTRLLDLGIPGYLIASSVTAIVAQRLVRRLCDCRREVTPTAEFLGSLSDWGLAQQMDTVYVPNGCYACDHTGYRGRVGVYEILVLDDAVREAVRDGQSIEAIRRSLQSKGMRSLQQDAMEKVRAGITSFEEVTRVVPARTVDTPALCASCNRKIDRAFPFCPFCATRQVPRDTVAADIPRNAKNAALIVEEQVRL